MIDELEIDSFLNLVDPDNVRVHQPSSTFLICGGPREIDLSKTPPSFREAYLRICHRKPLDRHNSIVAEDLITLFDIANYRDILHFEADIAEICSLVLVFSESYGSSAELGAFALSPSIREKILTVIAHRYYNERSFIRFGPILAITNAFGDSTVCVMNNKDIDINSDDNLAGINLDKFFNVISDSITERLKIIDDHSTFDRNRTGHVIKLIVGIIQWYGALTIDEISICLLYFDLHFDNKEIENYLLCAEFAQWILREKRGTRTYYAAIVSKIAAQFTFHSEAPRIDRVRWQAEVRNIWKTKDPTRFNFIADAQTKAL